MSNTCPESDVYLLREHQAAQLKTEYQRKLSRIYSGISTQEYIAVDHSHDYPLLLKIFSEYLNLDPKQKKTALTKLLEHENLHAVPALANQELGMDVRYGIYLIGDQHRVDMMPAVILTGPALIDITQDMGQIMGLICFEFAINPVLISKKQSFSDTDRMLIAGYLQHFQMMENLHAAVMELFAQLPKKERVSILQRMPRVKVPSAATSAA